MSCSYGPSLNPTLSINIHVASSLLNMTYTQGYTPPPYVIANPNAYIPLTDQVTYTYGAGLSAVLSFPIQNLDLIQGTSPHNLPPYSCELQKAGCCSISTCASQCSGKVQQVVWAQAHLWKDGLLSQAAFRMWSHIKHLHMLCPSCIDLRGGRNSTAKVLCHVQAAFASQHCLAVSVQHRAQLAVPVASHTSTPPCRSAWPIADLKTSTPTMHVGIESHTSCCRCESICMYTWPCGVRIRVLHQDSVEPCLQVLLMQPNTTAVFSFQMTQAATYYGGVGTCNFNTTVNYAVRSRTATCPERAAQNCSSLLWLIV